MPLTISSSETTCPESIKRPPASSGHAEIVSKREAPGTRVLGLRSRLADHLKILDAVPLSHMAAVEERLPLIRISELELQRLKRPTSLGDVNLLDKDVRFALLKTGRNLTEAVSRTKVCPQRDSYTIHAPVIRLRTCIRRWFESQQEVQPCDRKSCITPVLSTFFSRSPMSSRSSTLRGAGGAVVRRGSLARQSCAAS
eukprot:4637935-Prymnesium_polylepis.1